MTYFSPYLYNRVYSELTCCNSLPWLFHAWVDTSSHPSVFISHYNGHGITLVRPWSAVDNTRDYARVSHSRQWYNYNIIFMSGMAMVSPLHGYSRQWSVAIPYKEECIRYAHLTHMQVMWYCLCDIFSRSALCSMIGCFSSSCTSRLYVRCQSCHATNSITALKDVYSLT